MKITINTDVIEQYGLNLVDYIMLMAVRKCAMSECSINKSMSFLKDNGLIASEFVATESGINLLDKIAAKSLDFKERNLDELVEKLQELWPKGSKDGKYRWRSNKTDVKRRFQKFFKIYGDKYTDKQIIEAARRYVKPFDDAYEISQNKEVRKYQKVLGYFVFKDNGTDSILANNLEAIINNEEEKETQVATDITLF